MGSVFDNGFRKQFMTKKVDKIIYLLRVESYCSAEQLLTYLNKTTDINFNYILDDLKSEDTLCRLINWREYYL